MKEEGLIIETTVISFSGRRKVRQTSHKHIFKVDIITETRKINSKISEGNNIARQTVSAFNQDNEDDIESFAWGFEVVVVVVEAWWWWWW